MEVNVPMPQLVKLRPEHMARYLESLPESERSQAGRYVKMYLEEAETTSREELDRFFNTIRKGYKSGSYRYIWGIIRRFYRVNDLPWPYRVSDTPVVDESDVFAPALDLDVVREMIEAAKKPGFPPREAFYLALSTTYGMRRVEMSVLAAFNINLYDRLLFIHTAKRGRRRYHLIPEEIYPYIERYKRFVHPVSVRTITRIWHNIEESIAFPHVHEVGWHSIRRTLNKYLMEEAKLPETVVAHFLRWKRSNTNMPHRYASVQVIGRDKKITLVQERDREVDETVFKVHPFLPIWQG